MPSFERAGAQIHYDVEGDGFPILLLAPGGMRSANEAWSRAPWNPRTALAGHYRLIGMDQRNAGRSTAPVSSDDGWHSYTADQVALLDHLGVEQCHVIGMCIGGPFTLGLLRAAPQRFRSAVLLQPVGIDGNRPAFEEMFDGWAGELADAHPEADPAAWRSYRSNMWGGGFVLTATPEQVAGIETPLLLLQGADHYHPTSVSREIADRAPDVTYVEQWKDEALLDRTDATIKEFLARHTP